MSADNPMMKFVRWRVRDLAACFYACKIPPIDEKQNCSTPIDRVTRKTMMFDPIRERGSGQTDGQKLRKKESNQGNASFESSKPSTNSKISEDDSSFLKEEEYLVFCFKNDGTIHIINDKRPSDASIASNTIKYKCGESAEKAPSRSHVDDDNTDDEEIIAANESSASLSNQQQKSILDVQAEGERNNDVEIFSPADEIKEINHNEIQEAKTLAVEGEGSNDVEVVLPSDEIKEVKQTKSQEGKTLSVVESSDSNQSDASSSSFAFPVLRWEWMGSPVHMPKSEDVGLQAQKARGVCLQCCRF